MAETLLPEWACFRPGAWPPLWKGWECGDNGPRAYAAAWIFVPYWSFLW
jgi:hypothetical protein